jgi:hypothetical protein
VIMVAVAGWLKGHRWVRWRVTVGLRRVVSERTARVRIVEDPHSGATSASGSRTI